MTRSSRPPPTIAVDLDDTLNDFTATLREGRFDYRAAYALAEPTFERYLDRVRRDAPEEGDLLSTEYSYFRSKIHEECYRRARPRRDGVAFLQWLKARQWRIVILTQRDLRRAHDCTRQWLRDHEIPFDHLFMAGNKIAFCRLWGVAHLVDDDPFNLVHGAAHGVTVYFPVMEKHRALAGHSARGFRSFDEIRPWMPE
jgi:uncharacterized HAD superfamily protein